MTDNFYCRYVKGVLDKGGAAFALLLLSPLLLILCGLLRFLIGSPILFRQVRPGLNGKPFVINKFRTMKNLCDAEGNLLPDEKRVTSIGQFIRSASLDELPELLNVLRGEMSLVGPRPLLMRYLERYSPEQARRNDVRPGITGWAQIHGRNDISWEEKFAYDVWYVDHLSFFLDTYILLVTFWKVLRHQGISERGHITASEFMGNQICSRSTEN